MLKEKLLNIYHRLLERYGPQHWWPGEGPFEVMVGAVLTQSAAWTNVEKAIRNLREAGVLSPEALRQLPVSELAALIFPSGYYNAKALKLKALADYLGKYQDDLEWLFAVDTCQLRRELLGVHGVRRRGQGVYRSGRWRHPAGACRLWQKGPRSGGV